MGKFTTLLKREWLKYGFETFAVLGFYQLAEYVERILNQNKEMTLGLHNKLAIRGRSSTVHIDLLNRLQSERESVIELLSN